jgi:alpha,alpha-trehalose phosphorylase (configuration-retaining)
VFVITKHKFHNILQGVAPPEARLTEAEIDKFTRWSEKNARCLERVFTSSNIIVLDDPQVVGLIPHIKRLNPGAKIIFRSRMPIKLLLALKQVSYLRIFFLDIQIRSDLVATPGSPQERTWNFLWSHIQHADLFVSHPIRAFVPHNVPIEKVLRI